MQKNTLIDADKLKRVADILKAIAHPIRLSILQNLSEHKKLTVNDLKEKINSSLEVDNKIEQSLLSNHLIKMKYEGILQSKRNGKHISYEITDESILKIFDCMQQCTFI